jgi:hypothetical protein
LADLIIDAIRKAVSCVVSEEAVGVVRGVVVAHTLSISLPLTAVSTTFRHFPTLALYVQPAVQEAPGALVVIDVGGTVVGVVEGVATSGIKLQTTGIGSRQLTAVHIPARSIATHPKSKRGSLGAHAW